MAGTVIRVGIDLGQRRDYTAISIVEPEGPLPVWRCHQLYRLPIGTTYPTVANRVVKIVRGLRKRQREAELRIDATGVGRPVLDLIRERLEYAGLDGECRVIGVSFTHGDRLTGWGGQEVSLGKAYLVSMLQAAIQQHRLRFPTGLPHREVLVEEVLAYEIHVDENANDTYGAFSVGSHDDLVTAVGLALIGPGPDAGRVAVASSRSQSMESWVRVREDEQEQAERARQIAAVRAQLRTLRALTDDDEGQDDGEEEDEDEDGGEAANAPRRPDGARGVPSFSERDAIAGRTVAVYDASGNIVEWESEAEAERRREAEAGIARSLTQLLGEPGMFRPW